jgi:hypothetical protein
VCESLLEVKLGRIKAPDLRNGQYGMSRRVSQKAVCGRRLRGKRVFGLLTLWSAALKTSPKWIEGDDIFVIWLVAGEFPDGRNDPINVDGS